MSSQIENYVQQKNRWLSEQINVAFPTPQSLEGRDLYLRVQDTKEYTCSQYDQLLYEKWVDELVLVEFHRLTIMFAILQASQWADNPDQEKLVIEFLTQIILNDEYQLYMGLVEGQPVAGLITKVDTESKTLFLSDIVVIAKYPNKVDQFISDIIRFLQASDISFDSVIYPVL